MKSLLLMCFFLSSLSAFAQIAGPASDYVYDADLNMYYKSKVSNFDGSVTFSSPAISDGTHLVHFYESGKITNKKGLCKALKYKKTIDYNIATLQSSQSVKVAMIKNNGDFKGFATVDAYNYTKYFVVNITCKVEKN